VVSAWSWSGRDAVLCLGNHWKRSGPTTTCPDGCRLSQVYCRRVQPRCRACGCWRGSYDGQLLVLECDSGPDTQLLGALRFQLLQAPLLSFPSLPNGRICCHLGCRDETQELWFSTGTGCIVPHQVSGLVVAVIDRSSMNGNLALRPAALLPIPSGIDDLSVPQPFEISSRSETITRYE
jgi:hypothetical protein